MHSGVTAGVVDRLGEEGGNSGNNTFSVKCQGNGPTRDYFPG